MAQRNTGKHNTGIFIHAVNAKAGVLGKEVRSVFILDDMAASSLKFTYP
jgi:hypothetical protein